MELFEKLKVTASLIEGKEIILALSFGDYAKLQHEINKEFNKSGGLSGKFPSGDGIIESFSLHLMGKTFIFMKSEDVLNGQKALLQ